MMTERAPVQQIARQEGAAAVELALVLPLLLLLVFGIAEFGRAYHFNVSLTGGAREGARVFALGSADPVATTRDSAPTLDPSLVSVSCTVDGSPVSCTSTCTAGSKAGVVATYPFDYLAGFSRMVQWFGGTAPGPITLTGIGVMRCGG